MIKKLFQLSSILFIWTGIFSTDLLAQKPDKKKIKSSGFVYNLYAGFNNTGNGFVENADGRTRFSRDLNNADGRFVLDTYLLGSYFIIPKYLSLGAGAGFSKSFNPDFNQVPLIFELRGYIFQNFSALSLFLQYAFSTNSEDISKGSNFALGAAYQFNLFKKYFSLELGYKGRYVTEGDGPIFRSDNLTHVNGAFINIGYQF